MVSEKQKQDKIKRMEILKALVKTQGPDFDRERTISMFIVNFGMSRRLAVEEVDAVVKFLEE